MHIHHASFHQNPPRISSLVITGVPTHTHSSCMHPFIKLTGASARRSLAPSRDFSTCQNASLGLHSCSPGPTSSRLSPPSPSFPSRPYWHLTADSSSFSPSPALLHSPFQHQLSSPLSSRATHHLWKPLRGSTPSRRSTSSRLIFCRSAKPTYFSQFQIFPNISLNHFPPQKMGVGMRAAVRSQINLVMKRFPTKSHPTHFSHQKLDLFFAMVFAAGSNLFKLLTHRRYKI